MAHETRGARAAPVARYPEVGRPMWTTGKLKPDYLDSIAIKRWITCACGERTEARWWEGSATVPMLMAMCTRRGCGWFVRYACPLKQVTFHHRWTV